MYLLFFQAFLDSLIKFDILKTGKYIYFFNIQNEIKNKSEFTAG